MPNIHPTAIVDRECELAEDVEIGPYCIVRGKVRVGAGVRLISHVVVEGPAELGEQTLLYPNVCLGFPAQDFKFKPGSPTAGVVVGRQCAFREGVTIHAASNEHTPTRLGDSVYMMANAHIGHDCRVGDRVTMVNNSALGGHVVVGDGATFGGTALVHQHCRVGRLAMVAGFTANTCDVAPFCTTVGRGQLVGINVVGLRRAGMPREHITRLRTAYRRAFARALTRPRMLEVLEELGADCPPVREIADFIRGAKRPIAIGRQARSPGLQGASDPEMIPES